MKVVIFCGGLGTRFGSITKDIPKPLIEIGGFPILFHVMKTYADQGFKEFVLLLGYRQKLIKDWFETFIDSVNDFTLDLVTGKKSYFSDNLFDWKISFLDTGVASNTAHRLWKARHLLNDEDFFLTYADGVGNINLEQLLKIHDQSQMTVTLTAVDEPSRLGHVDLEGFLVKSFVEKPSSRNGNHVNAGYFVVHPRVFDLPECLFSENSSWEMGPLAHLATSNQLAAYKHFGYWKSMDSERDRDALNEELQALHKGFSLFNSYE